MDNNTLKHWGIKGMKWGVRRYQDKNGDLTEAGRRRYNRDLRDYNGKKNKVGNPSKWAKEDLERTKKLTDASSHLSNELKRANDNYTKSRPKAKMDLSSMTDKQMRDEINRALLERQYNDMFAPQKTSRGREFANTILESAGTVLAVTSSALGVALAIKELRG